MCQKHYYYSASNMDGKVIKQSRIEECDRARRRGQPCDNPEKFRHPMNEMPPQSSSQYPFGGFPPSPPSSDTSFPHSGSEADRANKRRSGVYVNGERVLDINRRSSRRERRNSNHVVIVEPPASPRTPPRFETPVGSPSRSPTYSHEPRQRVYTSHQRPEVRVEVNTARPRRNSQSYYRHTSRPSQDSHSRNSASDEEARTRKLERDLKKAEEAARFNKLQSEINRANEDIANRPAVPPAPQPLNARYRRPSVSIRQTDDVLAEALRNVRIQETAAADAEKERRRRDRVRQRDEDEAQRQRLLARMAPIQRSSTSTTVRPKVYGENIVYR